MTSYATNNPEYLFVYGTLMRSLAAPMHAALVRYADFVSEATMLGKMYEIENYPGVIDNEGAGQRVKGEVYQIRNAAQLLPILDDYEGVEQGLYVRAIREALLKNRDPFRNTDTRRVWVYLFHRDISDREWIENGDYFRYQSRGK